ncbi:ArsR/SmtB family transcription factor [Humibacter ginsengisoli]
MGVAASASPAKSVAPDDGLESEASESAVLRAVAEPRRRAILRLVASQELSAGEIASTFDVSRPAVSQHLTVLKEAGLLAERRDGTRRLYRTRVAGLSGLRRFLDDVWGNALADAARIAEAGADDGVTAGDGGQPEHCAGRNGTTGEESR